MMYHVSFRIDDTRYVVHRIDGGGHVHMTTDTGLVMALPEDAVPYVIKVVLDQFGPAKVTITPVGV